MMSQSWELEGDNIQKTVVIPTVDGGSNGVEVQLLRHLECLGGNRNLPYVDLDSEARISGNALGRFSEAPADEISSARDNSRLGETSRNTRLDVRAEVFAYNVFVLRQIRLLGCSSAGSALKCSFLPLQHVQPHIGRSEVAAEDQKVL